MNIVIYTNILTPYRTSFYDALYRECTLRGDTFHVLLMAETEPGRNWHYEEYKTDYTILLHSRTITVSGAYIHYNSNLHDTLRKLRPDVLICAGSYLCPGIWQTLNWRSEFQYKVCYWSESHLNETRSYGSLKLRMRESIRKRVYSRFDGFWFAGRLSGEFIERYAGQDFQGYFVPNLVDEEKYKRASEITEEERLRIRRQMEIPDGNTVFFSPIRLTAVKGMDRFLPILQNCESRDQITLLIAGDGEQEGMLRTMAEQMRLDVRLLGFQNQADTIRFYAISDIFLLPSISDPNPLSCIEALWSGLPLLISEHCGNYPEVIRSGENGFVFNYKDVEQTEKMIDELVQSDNTWRADARRVSQQIACEKYRTGAVVGGLVDWLYMI